VRVVIHDNGIGIERAHQGKIFRIFERAAAANIPGTGIGLAIVKKAAERMGGAVGVKSAPGQGSQFWIDLPKAPGTGRKGGQAKSKVPSSSPDAKRTKNDRGAGPGKDDAANRDRVTKSSARGSC
jgi:hypothetical protein